MKVNFILRPPHSCSLNCVLLPLTWVFSSTCSQLPHTKYDLLIIIPTSCFSTHPYHYMLILSDIPLILLFFPHLLINHGYNSSLQIPISNSMSPATLETETHHSTAYIWVECNINSANLEHIFFLSLIFFRMTAILRLYKTLKRFQAQFHILTNFITPITILYNSLHSKL